jgi:predicted O-linked N-acetylglucosamine transferase (SPINDLY family)
MAETTADFKELSSQALALHQRGQLAEAEQLYIEIIRKNPTIVGPRYMLGVMRLQQGRVQEAVELMAPSAKVNPDDVAIQMNYAMALRGAGRLSEALSRFQHAVKLRPDLAEAHYNSGVVQAELGRFENAIQCYEKALVLKPDMLIARGNLGIALAGVGRLDDAVAQYGKVLDAQPADAATLYNRGLARLAQGRRQDALADFEAASTAAPGFADPIYQRAIALSHMGRFAEALLAFDAVLALTPNDPEIHSNRSVALWNLGRPEDALASAEKALEIDPGLASAWYNKGVALKGLARFQNALDAFDRMITHDATNADGWNSRGAVLRVLGRPSDAVASFTRAIELRPGYIDAINNRAHTAWTDLGLYAAAIADLKAAQKADPDHPYLTGELLHLKMQGADWQDYDILKQAVDDGVHAKKRVIRPFAYQAISDNPADLRICSEIFAADQFPAMTAPAQAERRDGGKLRVGYVSADFREQATAYLMAGLYEHHDQGKFEIVAFDNGGSDASPMRARLEKAIPRIVDITGMSDDEAANAVRAEKIDILVNLNGYFGKPRMGLFARRPAPVQVNYLGFPATLGAPYIDYILADGIVIPQGEERFYTEAVVRMPNSYQINDDRRPIAGNPTRAANALPDDGFVFCNFNQGYKLTPALFDVWARVMNKVPGSVLWLLDSHEAYRINLGREAEARGISRQRLVFAPAVDLAQHLARLKLADLFLDSLPYNAHTTASDALWAGIPLLTCRGTTFAGRVAASLLTAAGVPELITNNMPDYEKLAVALATDTGLLKSLREKIAQNRKTCALFDTARTTRQIEAAYQGMWDRRGTGPSAFNVGG